LPQCNTVSRETIHLFYVRSQIPQSFARFLRDMSTKTPDCAVISVMARCCHGSEPVVAGLQTTDYAALRQEGVPSELELDP